MTDLTPTQVTNLDRYGNAALPWSRPHELLKTSLASSDMTTFLGTVRPDGRPHSAGVGALWMDDNLYFTSSPAARKARNLVTSPACTMSLKLKGIDLVMEGEASRVTDKPTLERAAQLYREGGWPVQVQGDAFTAPFSAPSAGPPPWSLYRFNLHTAFGVATAEPHGATRWRFRH